MGCPNFTCDAIKLFCRYKKQPGLQVLNDKPKSFHWQVILREKRHQKFGNRANGSDSFEVNLKFGV
jgi:hypothetical protein